MKFNAKIYRATKTKNYIKNSSLFFLFNGVNRKSNDWIIAEQELKKINYNYYKLFNKTVIKTTQISIYRKIETTINGITFFIKPNSKLVNKNILLTSFEPLLFTLLAVKLNNKIYSVKQLKNIYSLKYRENKLLFYQFGIKHLKIFYKIPN